MQFRTIVVAVCAAGLVVGCSGGNDSAGDTTCKAFGRMSEREQHATVSRILEERGEADGPSVTKQLRLSSASLKITTGCFGADNARTKIGTFFDPPKQ